MVGAIAPTYLFDFCCAKMVQFCNCARLVLSHALFILFGKASLGFFEVVDSVSCFESERLESKLSLESESALDSRLFGFCVVNSAIFFRLRFCICVSFRLLRILDPVCENL